MENETAAFPPPPPRPRRFGGCLPGILCGCLGSVLLLALLAVGVPAGIVAVVSRAAASAESAPRYRALGGDAAREGARRVLRLELGGVIADAAPSRWYRPEDCAAAVREEIERAVDDASVDAILLVIDSPGGAVGASDALYHALERFKAARPGRKVVVQAGGLLASGAYYVAMQADWIRLSPTTVAGSIGVILPGLDASALARRLGVADASVASGPMKDLGNPLKPADPARTAVLRGVVEAMHARFVAVVARGRGLTEADVRAVADGRVFSASDAVNLRLADDVGYEDTLGAELARLLGCAEDDLAFCAPRRRGSAFRAFYDEFPAALGRGLAEPFLSRGASAPQYLFR